MTPTSTARFDKEIINEALDITRDTVSVTIEKVLLARRQAPGAYRPLYELLSDYPFRIGKSLRPTICVSVARAVGGMGHAALVSSAALELYHNAFLIHDDVEDGSEKRRGKGTLHELVGLPRAVNAGDATNVLAVGMLLDNLEEVGVAKALHVLHEIEHMARQSVEGQAMELDWVATNAYDLGDADYFRMCIKKTCWYSFITPCRIGLIVGQSSAEPVDLLEPLEGLTRFGMSLGIAFQIQDDLLNLEGEVDRYGKEIGGDIFEGKRTVMLNHLLAHADANRDEVLRILSLPRPEKTVEQVEYILEEMRRCGSFDHARRIARREADKAAEILESLNFLAEKTPIRSGERWRTAVADRRFLRELVNYVIYRNL
ncbi:MAG: polyprenyl synthetase family protein [Thermoanaerobaculia bacterium]